MNIEVIKREYENIYGVVNEQLGYSLTFKSIKSGILCFHWYKRSSWMDETLERKVLFSNGKIYENNNEVGRYDIASVGE